MNNIKIKVNGVAISLENSPVINDTSLEDMSAALSKESEDLTRQFKAIAFLSNVKTVESFGYKSTEGLVGSIKDKLVEWFKKLVDWLKRIRDWIKNKLLVSKADKIKDPSNKAKAKRVLTTATDKSVDVEKIANDVISTLGKDVSDQDIEDTVDGKKAVAEEQKIINDTLKDVNKAMDMSIDLNDIEAVLGKGCVQAYVKEFNNYMDSVDSLMNTIDNMSESKKKQVADIFKQLNDDYSSVKSEYTRKSMKNKDGSQYKGNFNQFMNDKNTQLSFS